MIGSLRGKVLERHDTSTALVEVSGVGYLVHVTPRTLAELEPTSSAFLYVHHHIREDSQVLFGFLSRAERDTFNVLIATHGIGPSLALAILGVHNPASLVNIVASGDLAGLTVVPGVGKKTAERLLVELKNKLDLPVLSGADGDSGTSPMSEVREALAGLGYGTEEIREAIKGVTTTGDTAAMLREALSMLGSSRA
jgi:holliday junction DNA helicase RuvA